MVNGNRRITSQSTLFFPPRSRRLASQISITSPQAFQKSIKTIKKGGVTLKEFRGLQLAQNRARAQLGRKNLSLRERLQFNTIATMKIPRVTQ